VAEESKSGKPVSMRKASAESTPPAAPPSTRPRTVTAAAIAIAVSGFAAILAALTLLGERDWLTSDAKKANVKSVSSAVSSAVADATHKGQSQEQIKSVSASASASATKTWPINASGLHDHVTRQQTGAITMSVFLCLALAFVGFGVYRGKHWSRWGVVAIWVLASFTGTFAGVTYIVTIGSNLPAAFKGMAFISALALLIGLFFANRRESTTFFAAHRPVPVDGMPQRRGLFAPRIPPPSHRKPAPAAAKPSESEGPAESQAQRQRSKKRANAEAVARGAELARNRAKASKSRRTDG